MNIGELFIRRPVATTIIILALFILGCIAYPKLPISELPNVDFPTLVVSATLPGADPQTMASSVATPIEKDLSTIPGLDSMSSVSTAGSTQITLQFALDRNIDSAAQDAQSAILQVSRQLPAQMPNPPSIRKVNPAESPILYLALTANNLPMTKVDEYAENIIAPQLSMIEGVAEVNVYGAQQYAVRIHLNPNAMSSRNIGIDSVANIVQSLNSNQPSGTLQTAGYYRLITVDGQLNNASEFANAAIATNNGALVRLKDIARVEDSTANDKAITWYNNERSIVLAINRQPRANTVAVVNKILSELPALTQNLPGGAKLRVVYNRATFIAASIKDVQFTLIFAALLVVGVILLFLNNFSAMGIAIITLPIAMVATFAFMYLFGFNLDNLSLMGLVLAVGFVIDDAVVVLENIMRHIEHGLDRFTASIQGTKEIGFTVIAMTLSLVAVFIPIFFMGGIIGRLFHEFAAVVGITILLSGLVALTLIPMLCSRYLNDKTSHNKILICFERGFNFCKIYYEKTLRWALDREKFILLISLALLIIVGILFYIIPKGFIPSEDTNMIFGNVKAPEGITFPVFQKEQQAAASIIEKNPNVAALISSVGQGSGGVNGSNIGRLTIRLKPLDQRKLSSEEIIMQLEQQLQPIAGLKVFLTNPPAIRIGGHVTNSSYQYTLQSTHWDTLQQAAQKMKISIAKIKGVHDVDSDLEFNNPELQLHILRDKAATLGITPDQLESALYAAYGGKQVSSIITGTGSYEVIMDVDPNYQKNPSDINTLYLRSPITNQMIPLTSLVEKKEGVGPLSINHDGQLPAITLSFNIAPGYSLGSITSQIQKIAQNQLPADVIGSFSGATQKFLQSLKTLPLLLLFTVLVIYMVLAILYEHFIHPLTILTALPFAAFGALLSLLLFQQELNIFSFIGLVMLVGLTKKNGIMMVDFALEAKRKQKLTAKEAIIQACCIRFRPIMMTTLAALVATFPIALGLGAGGETRKPLGIAIVGGLLFSQMITLYVTPVFYLLMDKISVRNKT